MLFFYLEHLEPRTLSKAMVPEFACPAAAGSAGWQ